MRLAEVKPQAGDRVKVIESSDCWSAGRYWPGVIVQPNSAPGFHRVEYKGRAHDLHIEPDWDSEWPAGRVEYRELVPAPVDGSEVAPRNGDRRGWSVHLVLFGVLAVEAQTFDRFWFVVLYRPMPRTWDLQAFANYDPDYTRCWIRWDCSGHTFVPVQDPARIGWLNTQLPDAPGRACPLFPE